MEKAPKIEKAQPALVEKKEEKMELAQVRKELQEMIHEDQGIREKDARGDIDTDHDIPEKMKKIDEENTRKLKHIVDSVGWPTVGMVGKELAQDVWLLVQHADHDVAFQKLCLGLMKKNKQDVGLPAIAYLEDRIRVNEGRLQLYGTQFREVRGVFVPKDIASRKSVEVRRKKMGLPPLEEAMDEMYEKYHMKKPQE